MAELSQDKFLAKQEAVTLPFYLLGFERDYRAVTRLVEEVGNKTWDEKLYGRLAQNAQRELRDPKFFSRLSAAYPGIDHESYIYSFGEGGNRFIKIAEEERASVTGNAITAVLAMVEQANSARDEYYATLKKPLDEVSKKKMFQNIGSLYLRAYYASCMIPKMETATGGIGAKAMITRGVLNWAGR